ncbi:MAG TPA: alpha/beta hydrolase-fold protein [Hanamia sp.]|nr:alpha/beta hydrolase-fold protein [Hanamia sp.]
MKLILLIFFFTVNTSHIKAQDSTTAQNRPFVLGRINEIQSKILGEKRILNIYFPEGYNEKDNKQYPVIYLLDGSADEDFIHVAGLVQFLNFPWVDILPKSILVGIANVDRKRDFTFPTSVMQDKKELPTSGGSAKFIEFIRKELEPFIENHYRTNSSKTLIGQSLGGLLATEILFKNPDLFTKYIIVSPSLWWDNESLLKAKLVVPGNTLDVYIAVGNEEKIMVNDVHQLQSILKNRGKNTMVHFQYFPQENHATILHKAVYDAFETFAKKEKSE